MGPRLSLSIRRFRLPPTDLQKEALKQPKLGKKKVGSDAVRNARGPCGADAIVSFGVG